VTTTGYSDTTAPRTTSYYRVTAVDTAGLESDPAEVSATRKVSLRSVATKSTKDADSLTINRPAVSAGELMVAAVDVLGTPTISPPSGWTAVRTDTNGSAMRQAVYFKVATSNEPRSYSWGFSPRRSTAGIILVYQGAAGVSPVEASSGQVSGASNSVTAPSVSTAATDYLVVGFFGMAGNPSVTPPAEMLERAEIVQNGGQTKIMLEASDELRPPSGPTGARTATGSQSRANIGQLVVIRPQ
jgi:hypothetical protein